jgi:murein DD-endopeptidase MepM/ murein hydrolase activator NlpD
MAINHKELLDQLARMKALREAAPLRPGKSDDYSPLALDTNERGSSPVLSNIVQRAGIGSQKASQHQSLMNQNERNFEQYLQAQQQMQKAQQSLRRAEKLKALQAQYSGGARGGQRGGRGGMVEGQTSSAPQWVVDQINQGKSPRGNFQNKSGQVYWYNPPGSARTPHTGYDARWAGDINVPGRGDLGNPVPSYKPGVVETVKFMNTSYGNHVIIRHPDGTRTLYAHLSGIAVKPGQKVGGGQHIGRVGSTGKSSGPHLHFEIR